MPDVEIFSEVIATLSASFVEIIPGNIDEFISSHIGELSVLVHHELDRNFISLTGKLDSINKSKEILERSLLFNSDETKPEYSADKSYHDNRNPTWNVEVQEGSENLTRESDLEETEDFLQNADAENVADTNETVNKVEKVSKRGRKIRMPLKLENYDDFLPEHGENIDVNHLGNETRNVTKVRRKRRVGRPRKVKEPKEQQSVEDDKTDGNTENIDSEENQNTGSMQEAKENVYLNKKDTSRRKFNLIFEKALIGKRGIKKYYEDRLPFKFFCHICSFKSKRESHFHKHLELHSKNPDLKLHKCDKCDFTSIRVSVLQRHSLSHISNEGEILKCPDCSYTTNNEALLRMHRKRHIRKAVETCEFCSFSTMYKQKMLKHLETHSSDFTKTKGTESPNSEKYQCNKCSYQTMNKLNFTRHQRAVHLNQRPHLCDKCGMAFKRTDALQIHKEVHKDRSERRLPFSCKVCQKAFKSMAHVKEHMSVHTTVRSFQCHICGQMFKTRQVQQRHLQGVHLKTNWHDCNRCKRSFSSKYTLKRHLRQHDEDGNINLQGKIPKRIIDQMTGQPQDFIQGHEGQGQEQMDENATAIQTIAISSDNLGEFTQQLQTVSGQLQPAGEIGEVYIQGLENVVSDTVNIVSIQGDDISHILTSSSEPGYTEHVSQLSAPVADAQNTGMVQDLINDNVKIYQTMVTEEGLQISDKQSSDISASRADFNIPVETFKLTLDQLNSGTQSNESNQLVNQVNPELEVLNYETVHYVTDQGQIIEGENDGQIIQFIASDGQTYNIRVEKGASNLDLESIVSISK